MIHSCLPQPGQLPGWRAKSLVNPNASVIVERVFDGLTFSSRAMQRSHSPMVRALRAATVFV